MFPFNQREELLALFKQAKEGDSSAKRTLKERLDLRVFTQREIDEVNELILQGVKVSEAIKQIGGKR